MASERKDYLLDEFINTVQFKVDALHANDIVNALPIIVYSSEKIDTQFALTVFRLPDNEGTLIWTIFMNDGKDMLGSFPTALLETNIGHYLSAEIMSTTVQASAELNKTPTNPNQTASGIYLR